jgi:hypothetical protein
MGRTKGSKNVPIPDSVTLNQAEPTAKEAITDKTFTMTESQLKTMVDASVAKALEGKDTPSHIDDTGYWQATCRCQSEIFGCIDPEQVIKLDEENEKALKLGKFAEIRINKKTGLEEKITFAHLVKPNQFVLQRIMQEGEEKAVGDGLVIMPSLNHSQSLDEKKPFKLVSAKA